MRKLLALLLAFSFTAAIGCKGDEPTKPGTKPKATEPTQPKETKAPPPATPTAAKPNGSPPGNQ
jgi:hypothetical protein